MARTPLYQTATTEMLSRIAKGTWEVGRRLPNEFELAAEFGVSQGTMRRALIALEESGVLSRKPGRGTLVAAKAPVAKVSNALTPILLGSDEAPLPFVSFRGRQGTRIATSAETDSMTTERVSYLERTLKSGGVRAALEATAVPENLVPKLDEDAPVELAALLEHHGVTPASLSAEARAEVTDMGQSVALSCDRYTALLVVRMAAYDAGGQIIARQILRIATPGARLSHQ